MALQLLASSAAAARLSKPKTSRCSETYWRTGDWANTQPSGQGVGLFRARSRLISHETSKSLYGGDLWWFGGQLSQSLLALTCLALQPICPPLQSQTHPILILACAKTCSELPEEYKLANILSNATNAGVCPLGFDFFSSFFPQKNKCCFA